jgi:hypothetical protein
MTNIKVSCRACKWKGEVSPLWVDEVYPEVECPECGEWIGISAGQYYSAFDSEGAYNSDGDRIGSMRERCEDAPCCGCC